MGLLYDAVRYQVRKRRDDGSWGPWSAPILKGSALRRTTRNARGGSTFRISAYGSRDQGPRIETTRELRQKLSARLDASPVGVRLFVDVRAGRPWDEPDRDLAIVKCQVRLRSIPTSGNFLVDVFFAEATAAFPKLVSWGAAACRNVGSTSFPSQHRDWAPLPTWRSWGFPTFEASAGANAIDIHAARDVMDRLWRWTLARAEQLHLRQVIYWPSDSPHPLVWTKGLGTREYHVPAGGSDHDDHLHAEGDPQRSGADRCA